MKLKQVLLICPVAAGLLWAQDRVGNDATVAESRADQNTVGAPAPVDRDTRTGESRIPPSPQERLSDRRFVELAAQLAHADIAGAQLALTKSTDSGVRAFAQMLSRDHAAASKELLDLARKHNITLPDYSTPMRGGDLSHPPVYAQGNALTDVSGKEFDRLYIEREIEDHKAAIQLFEQEVESGRNADLTSFAKRTLPDLRRHLAEAQKLANRS